jgi:SAM-dependent methyltransferase
MRTVVDWPGHFGAMGRGYADRAFTGGMLGAQAAQELDLVMSTLGPGEGRRVLDVGAGTGRFSAALERAGWTVTAMDAAPQMLACVASAAPGATRVLGRLGEALPFPDAAFDAVVAVRVLKYVPAVAEAIRELARVAAPGAPVVFDLANSRSVARLGYGRSPMGFVRPDEIAGLVNGAGLAQVGRVDGLRLPHALVSRARGPVAARAGHGVESFLAHLFGPGTGRGARSIAMATVRAA